MIARLSSQPPLDHIVEVVAVAYGFYINWDCELEKWIVIGNSQRKGADCFYWSSDETNEEFFRELKKFFMDQGAGQYR
jgi:elongation factor P hydroxylase